jgi:hypothetical protein
MLASHFQSVTRLQSQAILTAEYFPVELITYDGMSKNVDTNNNKNNALFQV